MSKIPKIIHYCWFGGKPKPEDVVKYMETWKKCCPDYEIMEWNEENFDVNCNQFVKEAYEAKKWAFVADYARLTALYNYGGVYIDTDIEILKSFDDLLDKEGFLGWEEMTVKICTAVIGAQKGAEWIKAFMERYYDHSKFLLDDGSYDMVPNVVKLTELFAEKYGLDVQKEHQVLTNGIEIFPREYFSPMDWYSGIADTTQNTYTIHHFANSWTEGEYRELVEIFRKLVREYGLEKLHKIFWNL